MRYRLSIALLALLCAAPAHSQEQAQSGADEEPSVLGENLRQLTGQAGLIFKGVVSGIRYETNAETDVPYTLVTFRQLEAIKDLSGKLGKDGKSTLTIKLFGGLHESGTMTIASHVPEFLLGAVYLVFYTAGEWSVSPIVGNYEGVFRIVKSRTLNMDFVVDYSGRIVVSATNDVLRSIPLESPPDIAQRKVEPERAAQAATMQEERPIEIDKDSIYTEESVKRMMEREEPPAADSETPAPNAAGPADRAEMLRQLPSPPMSLDAFIKAIKDVDNRYRHEFADEYSKVYFEPVPLRKEREPVAPNQQ